MSTEKKSLMGTLQDLIKASEYDQKDLAKKAGVTAGTLSKYLNEKSEMPVYVFAEIIKALGVSADALLLGDEVEAEKKKKEPGVPEVLDALQVLLETLEPAIEFVPYDVSMTRFAPEGADYVCDDDFYFCSAFYETTVRCKAIGIRSLLIQDLLVSWENYKEAEKKTPRLKDLFRERIFEEDVKQSKMTYDSIEGKTGAFYKSNVHEALISTSKNSMPYPLDEFEYSVYDDLFEKKYDPERPAEEKREIRNINRELLMAAPYRMKREEPK